MFSSRLIEEGVDGESNHGSRVWTLRAAIGMLELCYVLAQRMYTNRITLLESLWARFFGDLWRALDSRAPAQRAALETSFDFGFHIVPPERSDCNLKQAFYTTARRRREYTRFEGE